MSDVNITANYTAQQLTRTERLSSQIRACGRHKQHIALLSQVSFSHHDKLNTQFTQDENTVPVSLTLSQIVITNLILEHRQFVRATRVSDQQKLHLQIQKVCFGMTCITKQLQSSSRNEALPYIPSNL